MLSDLDWDVALGTYFAVLALALLWWVRLPK